MLKKIILITLTMLISVSLFSARNVSLGVQFNIPDIHQITLGDANISLNLSYSGNTNQIYEPRTVNSTYSIVSTGLNKQLVAQLNQDMPNNTSLEVRAEAPQNAISLGYVALSAIPTTLVTNISNVNQQNLLLYFKLTANLGAPVSVNSNRVITFTIMD